MKKLCKQIDITDIPTILPWVRDCIHRHRKRYDFKKLLIDHGLSVEDYLEAIACTDYTKWDTAILNIAADAAQSIYERSLDLKAPTITHRLDGASGKERDIGCESAMQQVFDFIAVYSSMPVFSRRIVKQQASSVEGRGQIYGMRMIRKWAIKNTSGIEYAKRHGYRPKDRMKWFVKLDVKKCFPSCRADVFLRYFEKDCGNSDIIWLWQELLYSHHINGYEGFMIGALTSQWAAQYILSFAYHYAMSIKKPQRRGASERAVSHMIMFMDDMMLCGPSRRQLKRAVLMLINYLSRDFSLSIKPNWSIQRFSEDCGIDMMGFVVYPSGKTVIRARDWVKVRRMLIRSQTKGYKVSYKQAKRLTSYKGYIKHSNSFYIARQYHAQAVFQAAQRIVSDNERFGVKNGTRAVQLTT